MNPIEEEKLTRFLVGLGRKKTIKLLCHIFETKLVVNKDNHSHPDFVKYDPYFNNLCIIADKLWDI